MANEPNVTDSYSKPAKRPSKAWYLVPIFFGIIGGIVMYVVLKDRNREMAKKGVVLGIILTVASFVIGVVAGTLAFLFSHPLV